MRAFILLLSFLPVVAVSNAQTPTDHEAPPDVQIVKFSWSKERIGWEQNPFGGPNENFHEMQFRTRSEKRANDAKRSGNSAEASKLEREARADAAIVQSERQKTGPPRYAFLYKVSVKNSGAKAIKVIDWDYIFFDAVTGDELGRQQFTSEERIGPGKSKELDVFTPAPPTRTISVKALNKNERVGLGERVILMRVEYTDGTVWQRPQTGAVR